MKKIIKVVQPKDAPMHLTWIINNICTNACSYCPENLHNGSNHNYDWENARKFFKILFEKYPKIHCSVAGGEPSVSPFFPEIVKTFYDAGHTIGITSNAAKPAMFWNNISNFLTYICFSYHPEFPDPNFVKKVTTAAMNCPVTVRIMMLPSKWDECQLLYSELIDNKFIHVEPVRILNWGGENQSAHIYTKEQLDWFDSEDGRPNFKYLTHFSRTIPPAEINADFVFQNGEIAQSPNVVEYINTGLTNFYGYTCEVGLRSLFIDHNGEVFLSNCAINGSIGNINEPENIQWPTTAVVCDKTLCHCTTDVSIEKWKL